MPDDTTALTTGPPIHGEYAISSLSPFGLGHPRPHHFTEMMGAAWENLDNLPYAWKILTEGVCDGCSLGPRGLKDDVIPGSHLCMKRLKLLRNSTIGPFAPRDIEDITALRKMNNGQLRELGRVPYPFIYRPGDRGFSRVSWKEALELIGGILKDVPPARQGWLATSKGITNETYYAFTKTARLMGTNNVDFCTRLSHAATTAGLSRTIGVGAPTVSLTDLIGSDLVLLWGTNLAKNQPVSVKYLHHAKKAGTRVVSINAVDEKELNNYWIPSIARSAVFGSKLVDDFIQVKTGGDVALMNATLKLLIAWDAVDHAYIDGHTTGWDELVADLDKQDMGDLLQLSGVSIKQVEWLATLIARARSMVTVYSMGLTQHRFGTDNAMGVVNLHLSQGALGKARSGILPIRNHSGMQGGGECGITPTRLPGGFTVNAESAARFEKLWGQPVPTAPGMSTGPMIDAALNGSLDFLYNLGGNLVATMPDPKMVVEAFGKVRLRIHQDININTATLIDPGELLVLLPAQTRYEQQGGGTSTSTERRIRFSPEIEGHPRVGDCKPEWEIPGLVATAARPELCDALLYADAQDIRNEMGETMPIYKGIETLRKAEDSIQWGGPQLCRDGDFSNMPDGKAKFSSLEPTHIEIPTGWFYMTTRRGKQFNSMVFAENDTLQGGKRTDVFLSAEDALRLSLAEGDPVKVVNPLGSLRGRARVVDIAPGCIQTFWPEGNVLIEARDPLSEELSYSALVRIERE